MQKCKNLKADVSKFLILVSGAAGSFMREEGFVVARGVEVQLVCVRYLAQENEPPLEEHVDDDQPTIPFVNA